MKIPPPENRPELTQNIDIYQYAPTVMPSGAYAVTVNGRSSQVIPTDEPHLSSFGCDGTVEVIVTPLREHIREAAVRPVSRDFGHRIENDAVVLYMRPYDRAVVEINGDEEHSLFLFANPLETDKPDPDDPSVLYFKAGTVTDIPNISVSSGQTVYIEGGAVVRGSISARNVENVAVRGCGILDGRVNSDKVVFAYRVHGLTIENITVLNASGWTTMLAECTDITATGYKAVATASMLNASGNENDAFDLLGCSDAEIRYGFSYCHDDTFCIKAQKWSYCGTVDNILFYDCIAWNKECGNSFEIGYELNQNVSNITYRNVCSIRSSGKEQPLRRGVLSLHNGAGGKVSDVLYENVRIEDPREYGIYASIIKTSYEIGAGVTWTPGEIENVTYRDVHMLHAPKYGNIIEGYDDGLHRIGGVRFENVRIGDELVTERNIGRFFAVSNADVEIANTDADL